MARQTPYAENCTAITVRRESYGKRRTRRVFTATVVRRELGKKRHRARIILRTPRVCSGNRTEDFLSCELFGKGHSMSIVRVIIVPRHGKNVPASIVQ